MLQITYSTFLDIVEGEVEKVREWVVNEANFDWTPYFRVMRDGIVYHYESPEMYLLHCEDRGFNPTLTDEDIAGWRARTKGLAIV